MPIIKSAPRRHVKFSHIADCLREQIEAGEFKPGDRLPSFAELRATFEVTPNTVSRALVALEQDGLITREQGRGTFVAERGRAAAPHVRGSLGVIGVASTSGYREHPYYLRILQGLQKAAHDAGREVLLLHQGSAIAWEKVDGVVLPGFQQDVQWDLPVGMPSVSLVFPREGSASVVSDDYQGTMDAVAHLVGLGHRRIGFLTLAFRTDADVLTLGRYEAYKHALGTAGIKLNPAWVRPLRVEEPVTPFMELGRQKMKAWLEQDWADLGCSALLTQNDDSAMGVIEALQAAGLRVPADVSVVGFDGTEISEYFRPCLTTVQVPLHEMGAKAVDLLIRQSEAPLDAGTDDLDVETPETTLLPTTLKIGGSTAEAARGSR